MSRFSPFIAPTLFFFLAVITDTLGVIINALQVFTISAIITPLGAATGIAGVAITFFEKYIFDFGITESALFSAALLFGAQMMLSLIVIVVFFSLVLSAPRGRYPIFICILAITVFLLESLPFVSALPFWGFFAWILRGRRIMKMTKPSPQK